MAIWPAIRWLPCPGPAWRRGPPKPLLGWDKNTVSVSSPGLGGWCGPSWTGSSSPLAGHRLRSGELLTLNLATYQSAQGDAMVRVIGKGPNLAPCRFPNRCPPWWGPTWPCVANGWGSGESWAPWRCWSPRPRYHPGGDPTGGRRLTASQLDHLLRQVLAAAGLGATNLVGANAHAYRHTYGTLLAAEGTPGVDLQGLMGHASRQPPRAAWTPSHGTAKPPQRPTPPCATFGPRAPSLDPTSWAGRQPGTYAVPMMKLGVPTYLQFRPDQASELIAVRLRLLE
jgi:hypothetical protein